MKNINLLTDALINEATPREKEYTLNDGKGLCLAVKPTGTKSWVFRYRINGKVYKKSFGKYPDISITKARLHRKNAKYLKENGFNPAEYKNQELINSIENIFIPVILEDNINIQDPLFREALLEVHNNRCFHTNKHIPSKPIKMNTDWDAYEIDHIVPKSLGGTDRIENLVPCLKSVNYKKRNTFDESLSYRLMLSNKLIYAKDVLKVYNQKRLSQC